MCTVNFETGRSQRARHILSLPMTTFHTQLKAREGENPTEPLERDPGRLGADGVVPIVEVSDRK